MCLAGCTFQKLQREGEAWLGVVLESSDEEAVQAAANGKGEKVHFCRSTLIELGLRVSALTHAYAFAVLQGKPSGPFLTTRCCER